MRDFDEDIMKEMESIREEAIILSQWVLHTTDIANTVYSENLTSYWKGYVVLPLEDEGSERQKGAKYDLSYLQKEAN